LIIGDHDLGELGGQIGRLGDHPDPSFRSVRAGNHTTDVVVVDAHRGAGTLLAT
jgi:hypothetical protein